MNKGPNNALAMGIWLIAVISPVDQDENDQGSQGCRCARKARIAGWFPMEGAPDQTSPDHSQPGSARGAENERNRDQDRRSRRVTSGLFPGHAQDKANREKQAALQECRQAVGHGLPEVKIRHPGRDQPGQARDDVNLVLIAKMAGLGHKINGDERRRGWSMPRRRSASPEVARPGERSGKRGCSLLPGQAG